MKRTPADETTKIFSLTRRAGCLHKGTAQQNELKKDNSPQTADCHFPGHSGRQSQQALHLHVHGRNHCGQDNQRNETQQWKTCSS